MFAAIAALPDDQRDVVAAVDVAGLSYAEAAETLGVPAGTVMSRLHRGRTRVATAVAVAALRTATCGWVRPEVRRRVRAHLEIEWRRNRR